MDGYIAILAGAAGMVEVNKLMRSERAVQVAFCRRGCAEQSVVQDTLDACTGQNNMEMYRAVAQIASRLGVHRSTILRNLADIQAPVSEAHGRYFIDREAYLVNLRLTLHEALSVHLAGRLMATCMDRANPHAAAAALRKPGLAG